MNKGIGIGLIVLAIILGVMGYNTYDESTAAISIGELELSAEDSGGQGTAFLYFGLAIASLIGGLMMYKR